MIVDVHTHVVPEQIAAIEGANCLRFLGLGTDQPESVGPVTTTPT